MINKSRVNDLQRVQDTCVKLLDVNMTLPDLYKTQRLLKVDEIIRLEQLKLGYKLKNNLLPESLTSQLSTDPDKKSLTKKHGYTTRSKGAC